MEEEGWLNKIDHIALMFCELAANVRPKFFDDASNSVPSHLRPPNTQGVDESAVVHRMVEIGDGCCNGAAADFGEIELSSSCVISSNQLPDYCIPKTMEKPSLAELKIARILVKERRENRSRPEIFVCVVGEG